MSEHTTVYGENMDDNYSSVSTRLALLLREKINVKNIYSELEKRTLIPRDTWRQWHKRWASAEPSARLIQAAALEWPQYAFWLITGYSDPMTGHIAPNHAKQGFHNNRDDDGKDDELPEYTWMYFKSSIDLIRRWYGVESDLERSQRLDQELNQLDQKKLDILLKKRLKIIAKKIQSYENSIDFK